MIKKIFDLPLRVGWPWERLFDELPLLFSQLLKLNGALDYWNSELKAE